MSNGISKKNYRAATAAGSIRVGWAELPPEIMLELGGMFSEWGFVEIQMDTLLSTTIGNPGVGLVLRKELHTSKQRRSVLAGLVAVSTPHDLRSRVSQVVGNFNRLAEERGLYAHGIWGVHEGYPSDAVLSMDDSAMRVMHPDLEAVAKGAFATLVDDVKRSTAVVTVRDVQRFRKALKRVSDEMHAIMFELQMRRRSEEMVALSALQGDGV